MGNSLEKIIFCLPRFDLSPKAGGAYLTFQVLLKELKKRCEPKLFVQIVDKNLKKDLDKIGVKLLSISDLKTLVQNPKNLLFIYPWHPILKKTLEEVHPKRTVIRQSALMHPYCSAVDYQEDECWLSCSKGKYWAHYFKNSNPFAEMRMNRIGTKYFEQAEHLNYPARGLESLMNKRFPKFSAPSKVIFECIHFDENNFQSHAWNQNGGMNRKVKLLFFSKWAKHKGLHRVLPIVAMDYECEVFGDGEDVDFLKSKYPNLKVNFHGHVDGNTIFEKLSKNFRYIYVHPAKWFEVYGRTIPESLYAGIPAVLARSSGAFDDLKEFNVSEPYSQKNLETLLPAIKKLESLTSEKYQNMLENMTQASKRFSVEQVIPEWLEYLESLATNTKQSMMAKPYEIRT